MIASELAAAVFAAAMVFADVPALLVGLAALVGLAEAPFMPASSAAVPNLVGNERLEWANSTLAVGRNVGQLLGPLCGGVLAAAGLSTNTSAASGPDSCSSGTHQHPR